MDDQLKTTFPSPEIKFEEITIDENWQNVAVKLELDQGFDENFGDCSILKTDEDDIYSKTVNEQIFVTQVPSNSNNTVYNIFAEQNFIYDAETSNHNDKTAQFYDARDSAAIEIKSESDDDEGNEFDPDQRLQMISKAMFTCRYCYFGFPKEEQWLMHQSRTCREQPWKRNGNQIEIYQCDKCEYDCRYKETLARHELLLHSDKIKPTYPCAHCKFSGFSHWDLSQHLTNTHADVTGRVMPLLKCQFCHKIMENSRHLDSHLVQDHQDKDIAPLVKSKLYTCPCCSYCSLQKRQVTHHAIKKHITGKNKRCHYMETGNEHEVEGNRIEVEGNKREEKGDMCEKKGNKRKEKGNKCEKKRKKPEKEGFKCEKKRKKPEKEGTKCEKKRKKPEKEGTKCEKKRKKPEKEGAKCEKKRKKPEEEITNCEGSQIHHLSAIMGENKTPHYGCSKVLQVANIFQQYQIQQEADTVAPHLPKRLPPQHPLLSKPLPPQRPFLPKPLPPQRPLLPKPLPPQHPRLPKPLPPQQQQVDKPQPEESPAVIVMGTESHVSRNPRPYICQLCSHWFKKKVQLTSHLLSVHRGQDVSHLIMTRIYLCRRCDFKTATEDSIRLHMRKIHLPEATIFRLRKQMIGENIPQK